MTRFVAVTTVRDDGAAAIAGEALQEADIPVELKRLGASPYFGSVTVSEIEVRVPEGRVAEARAALEALAGEAERSAVVAAGVPPEDLAGEAPADEPRASPSRKLSWAIVIALLVPFPVGCLYARAFSAAWILLGMFGAGWIAALAGMPNARALVLFAKGADLLLAPLFVVAENRRNGEKGDHAAHP